MIPRQNDFFYHREKPSFWIEDVSYLFRSGKLIPKEEETFEEQMNAISRFLLVVFVVLLLFYSITKSFQILGCLLLVVICSYYVGKLFAPRYHVKELYGDTSNIRNTPNPPPFYSNTNKDLVITPTYDQTHKCRTNLPSHGEVPIHLDAVNPSFIDGRQSSVYCYGDNAGAAQVGEKIQYEQNYSDGVPFKNSIGVNQKLAGTANPKTLVQPVIPSPIYDFETWKPNDMVIPSGINDQKNQELFQNGYVSNFETFSQEPKKGLQLGPLVEKRHGELYPGELHESYENPNSRKIRNNIAPPSVYGKQRDTYSSMQYPVADYECGFQPINLDYNLPSNYQANECQYTDKAAKYNNDIFQIPIQPGVYTNSQVNQTDASMANLGISFIQPNLPTTLQQKNGYQTFTEIDPTVNQLVPTPPASPQFPLRRDIYDPRTTGYGTDYRAYNDPLLGQPRYYYKDIDQQNNNGYLTRNKIDFATFGTTTGPYPGNQPLEGNALHEYADGTYTNSMIGYRTELQQRLMNKNSNREWQQRIAPIRTNVQTRGFMGTSGARTYAGPRGG